MNSSFIIPVILIGYVIFDFLKKDKFAKATSSSASGFYDKNFEPYYDANIKPNIASFEEERIDTLKSYKQRIIAAGVFMVVYSLLHYHIHIKYFQPHGIRFNSKADIDALKGSAFVYFLVASAVYYFVYQPIKQYKGSIKNVIFPKIFGYFGNVSYSPKGSRSIEQLNKDSGIYDGWYEINQQDSVAGSYKDVSYEVNEVEIKTTGKNSRLVFLGRYIILSANKNFSGRTIINKSYGAVGNLLQNTFAKNMEKINLEDPEFNKSYVVHSTDQIEARYLLTTSFMQRLLRLSDRYGQSNVQCSFFNNQILITLNMFRQDFEIGSISQPCNFYDDINEILLQMSEIFQVIDILKLNQKIGM